MMHDTLRFTDPGYFCVSESQFMSHARVVHDMFLIAVLKIAYRSAGPIGTRR